jgi:hypothetical protein
MVDRGGVDLDVVAAPQFGFRATTWPLGGLGLAMVLMGAAVPFYSPALWKVALLFASVGLATMALAALIWRKTGQRGPVLVLREDSIGLPQMAAGKAPAPTRLRWSEVETLALTGPDPEALVVVLTAEAARARGVAVPAVPDDPMHPGNPLRLRLPLAGLSETPQRIGAAVARAAEGAGMVRDAGLARQPVDGTSGPGQHWGWLQAGQNRPVRG